MNGRGRRPGFVMTDEHRTKIANSQILNCLVEHVQGKRDMSATQVTAGVALLKKIMPDLAAIEIDANHEHVVHTISDVPLTAEQWLEQSAETSH